ncbi:MAG TPA: MerR family transcriptional regulator [Parasegetibacter sp.]|jgi:DNA-binding transcriptional MerR regulator
MARFSQISLDFGAGFDQPVQAEEKAKKPAESSNGSFRLAPPAPEKILANPENSSPDSPTEENNQPEPENTLRSTAEINEKTAEITESGGDKTQVQLTAEIVSSEIKQEDEILEILDRSGEKNKISISAPGNRASASRKSRNESAKRSRRGRKSLKEMEAEAERISIPEDDILFSKQYYGIGEVAAMFGVNTSLIRFWETEFDIIKPKKNKKGDRFFRPVDVKNLHMIYTLLRRKKFTIEGAKDYLKRNKKKAEQNFEIEQSLRKIRSFLLQLKADL